MSVSSPSSVSVLLADPNDVARAGLKAWLTEDPRFAIAGDTAGDAVAAAGRLRPDVIVVDPLTRQGFDVRMITDLAAIAPDSRICVYTNGFEPRSFLDAMLAGAQAYLLKHNTSGELLREALVLAGRFAAVVVDPLIAEHFRTRASGELTLNAVEPEGETLTPRERQVLALLVEVRSTKTSPPSWGSASARCSTMCEASARSWGHARACNSASWWPSSG